MKPPCCFSGAQWYYTFACSLECRASMDPTIHHGLGDLLIAENTLFLRDINMVQVIHRREQASM